MAVEQIEIKVVSNIPEAAKQGESWRMQIRQLKKELDTLDQSSEEYEKTIQKLANATQEYQDEMIMIRNSAGDLGAAFTNLNKVNTDLASGFAIVTSAQALFGGQSEALDKTMVKLQAAIALVKGMEGLEGMGKDLKAAKASIVGFITSMKAATAGTTGLSGAMKVLKAAIASTGIGLLVVALAALIANFDKILKLFGYTSPAEQMAAAIENLDNKCKSLDAQLTSLNTKALKDYTKALNEAAGETDKINEATEKYNETLRQNAYQDAHKRVVEYQAALINLRNKGFDKNKKTIKEYNELVEKLTQAQAAEAKAVNDMTKARSDKLNKEYEAQKKLEEQTRQRIKTEQEAAKKANEASKEKIKNAQAEYKAIALAARGEYEAAADALTAISKINPFTDADMLNSQLKYFLKIYTAYTKDTVANAQQFKKDYEYILGEGWPLTVEQTQTFIDNKNKIESGFESIDIMYNSGRLTAEEYYKAVVQYSDNYMNNLDRMLANIPGITEEIKQGLATILSTDISTRITESTGVMIENIDMQMDEMLNMIALKMTDAQMALESATGEEGAENNFWGRVFGYDSTSFQEIYDAQVAYFDQMYQLQVEQLDRERELLEQKLQIESLSAQERANIENQLAQNAQDREQATTNHYKQQIQARNNLDKSRQSIVSGAASATSKMLDGLASNYDESSKTYKRIKIIQTTIDTFSAAMAAYQSMAGIPYVGPVLGAMAAAGAIASGIANINAIKNADSGSTASTASTSATPDVSSSLINGDAYASMLGDETEFSINELSTDTKVYVTESDISSTQNDVKTKVKESTF